MFTFRSTSVLFICVLILLVIINFFSKIPGPVFFAIFCLYLIVIGLGSAFISWNFYLKAICSAPNANREISLTFDDGPDGEITEKVLDLLKHYNVVAAFFCIGKKVEGHEAIIRRIHEEGHIIGNHTFSHAFWFDFYPAYKVKIELAATSNIIYNLIAKRPLFFRPPYGVTNPAIAKALKKSDHTVIGWNIRSLDTVIKNESKLLERVSQNLKGGDIILFHDTNQRVIQVLKEFLEFSAQNGFKIVRLDKLIKKDAYV